jgi:hypothetical protein
MVEGDYSMLQKELREVGVFLLTVIALSYFVFWGPIALFQISTVNLVGVVHPDRCAAGGRVLVFGGVCEALW